MRLYEIIRAAGGGASVEELATQAGVGRDRAEGALRTLLPALGRAIQRAGERPTGAATIHAAMQDERYARYLEHPATLREARTAADGERVLEEILDAGQRDQLVRNAAAAIQADDASVRRLLPLIAALAMGALGQELRQDSPEIPWFGTRPDDQFGAPLLNALAALFEQADEDSTERR